MFAEGGARACPERLLDTRRVLQRSLEARMLELQRHRERRAEAEAAAIRRWRPGRTGSRAGKSGPHEAGAPVAGPPVAGAAQLYDECDLDAGAVLYTYERLPGWAMGNAPSVSADAVALLAVGAAYADVDLKVFMRAVHAIESHMVKVESAYKRRRNEMHEAVRGGELFALHPCLRPDKA